jgi:hypothetical protein
MPPTIPPSPAQGHWQPAQILQAETNGYPLVAVDAAGRGLAAWGVKEGISFRRFDPTTGWAPLQLMRVDGLHSLDALVMNPAGVALIVWAVREKPHLATVWASHSNHDSDWGPAQRLDEDDDAADFSNFNLDAAISSGGGAVVVWTAIQVYAARFDPAAGWQRPQALSPGPAAAASVAIDSGGNAIAVWREQTGGLMRGSSSRFFTGVGWRPEDDFDRLEGSPFVTPQVAVDASGRGLLVWTGVGVKARQFQMKVAGWSPTTVLQESSGQTFACGLALNARGDGVTAWDTAEDLWASIFEPPNTWRQLERLVASDFRNAHVGIDAAGNRFVVFTHWNGTRDVLSARRYVPASGWGQAQPIDTVGQSQSPRLAVDPAGNALAVWSQLLPPTTAIWANRFETGLAP